MIIGQPVLSVNRTTCIYFINNEKMIFGERLKQARLEAGLSQGDLAKLVGVKQATVAEAEAVGKSSKKILEYDMNTEYKRYIAFALLLLALAWWFRYDTHCVERACISYDRFTGEWILPADKIKE